MPLIRPHSPLRLSHSHLQLKAARRLPDLCPTSWATKDPRCRSCDRGVFGPLNREAHTGRDGHHRTRFSSQPVQYIKLLGIQGHRRCSTNPCIRAGMNRLAVQSGPACGTCFPQISSHRVQNRPVPVRTRLREGVVRRRGDIAALCRARLRSRGISCKDSSSPTYCLHDMLSAGKVCISVGVAARKLVRGSLGPPCRGRI